MRAARVRLVCRLVTDTLALGERLGAEVRPGDLLSLEGPLGAGKTTLVRGVAIGTGVDPGQVRSPTFVLHHVYRGGRLTLHHLDLYRLGDGASLALLDIDGLLETGAVVVEWGDRADLSRWTPSRVEVEIGPREERVFILDGSASARLRGAWEPHPA